jgi:WD40 repeat protein
VRFRHQEAVHSVAFAPGGKTLATASAAGVVRLSDVATGRSILELPRGTGNIVLFTPDGKHLVCAGGESGLTLRTVFTGEQVRAFGGNAGAVGRGLVGGTGDRMAALSPDGKVLAAAAGTDVVLWDVATGQERCRLTGHRAPVYAVAFRPDGKVLAAGDGTGRVTPGLPGKGDTTIILWDSESGRELRRIPSAHHGWVHALAFAPDGETLASSSPYDSCLWDVASGEQKARMQAGGRSIAFAPDGKLLAAASAYGGMDQGFIPVWDPATGKPLHTLRGHVTSVNCVAFAPDGKTLASGGPEGVVRLWDAVAGRELTPHEGHQAEVRAVAFAPNGTLAATASGGDHTIRLWGTAGGTLLRTIDIPCRFPSHWCPTTHAQSLGFAPDGKTFLCDDRVFDVASGRLVGELPGLALAQSADGRLLAGRADDRHSGRGARVALWDRATGRELATFSPLAGGNSYDTSITAVAFSSDGQFLAIGAVDRTPGARQAVKDTVYLYETAGAKLLHQFRPYVDGPVSLAFSPDGDLLATAATWDQPVQLWRVSTGQEFRTLRGHEQNRPWAEHRPLAFSPDGKLLASGGRDNRIAVWDVLTGQEVHYLDGHQGAVRALAFGPEGRTVLSGGADTLALIWDLAPPGPKAVAADGDLVKLWGQLAGDDAAAAYRAAWVLAASPDRAVGLFRDRLRPLPEPDARHIPRLIADLNADAFVVRQAASDELKKFGLLAEEPLRKALDGKPPPEVRRRVELLLAELSQRQLPPEELRQLRAIQVLEWIGTPAARDALEPLARGTPLLRPSRDAEGALRRLQARRSAGGSEKPTAALPPSKPARAREPRRLTGPKGKVSALSFGAGGTLLAAATAEGTTVQVWDPDAGKLLRQLEADTPVLALAFSADGKSLATGGRNATIQLWDPNSGQPLQALRGHSGGIASLAFSKDGKLLASGSLDRTVRLWDVVSAQEVRTLTGHKGQVTSVAFSPDGKVLASGDLVAGDNQVAGRHMTIYWSDAVRLWDVATGREIRRLPDAGYQVLFAPDGSFLATADLSTELHIGDNAIRISRSTGGIVGEGQGAAAIKGDSAVLLWDVLTGQSRLRLGNRGTAMALAPDGRFLATARGTDRYHGAKLFETPGAVPGDGRLRLWEVSTGKEVLEFPAEVLPTVLAYGPRGRTLAAGTRAGDVLLWDLAPASARGRAVGPDTREFNRLWADLGGDDAAAAYGALWALREAGPKAVPVLEERLRPTPADDPQLVKAIADLGAADFAAREAAFQELRRRGAAAEPALCRALQRAPSAAVRQRLLALLSEPGILDHPEPMARSRAIGVLEAIGSPEARRLLEVLAAGSPLARQTQEAGAALQRLGRP